MSRYRRTVLWSLLTLIGLTLPALSYAQTEFRLQLRWLHQFQFAGYYIAKEHGYYEQAGLDVEIIEGGPDALQPVNGLLRGDSDFAISNSGVAIERMHGKPVAALAAIMQTSPMVWIVRGDSDIYTPLDLAERRLMIMPAPESSELLLMLRREGINLDQLDIHPTSHDIQDLIDGNIDAFDGYIGNEPYSMTQAGVDYRVISPREYGVNFYNDILITHERLIENKPQEVQAFVDASLRGWEYALASLEETVDLIHERYAPNKSRAHLMFEAEKLRELIMPNLVQIGHMNPSRWQQIAEDYRSLGMADGELDLDGFLPDFNAQTDYTWLIRGVALGILGLLIVSVIAIRFGRLNRRLVREADRRRAVESQLRDSHERLMELANTDQLTGVWNRLRFEEIANGEIERSHRYDYPLSLLFIDIDHFKAINDELGHLVGDSVLCAVARLIEREIRQSDLFCRWGGEEFLVMTPHTPWDQAVQLGRKLQRAVMDTAILNDRRTTISVGAAHLQQGDGLSDLVKKADVALYRAKENGRNRVEVQTDQEKRDS